MELRNIILNYYFLKVFSNNYLNYFNY